MNYELAKKLQDAGFPLTKCFDASGCCEDSIFEDGQSLHFPTLSELIEACGERFSSLTRSPRNTWYVATTQKESEWQVETVIDIECSTPSEAVANLWLALNKK